MGRLKDLKAIAKGCALAAKDAVNIAAQYGGLADAADKILLKRAKDAATRQLLEERAALIALVKQLEVQVGYMTLVQELSKLTGDPVKKATRIADLEDEVAALQRLCASQAKTLRQYEVELDKRGVQ